MIRQDNEGAGQWTWWTTLLSLDYVTELLFKYLFACMYVILYMELELEKQRLRKQFVDCPLRSKIQFELYFKYSKLLNYLSKLPHEKPTDLHEDRK